MPRCSRLARSLGADVPFALYGGAMVARGIGDVLTPAPLPDLWLVLVVPRIDIPRKTAALYGALDGRRDFGDGAAITRQVAGLRAGKPLDPALLGNAFLAPLERIAPAVADTRAAMESRRRRSRTSPGSGPTLVRPCATARRTRADARRIIAAARVRCDGASSTRTCDALMERRND